jgi:hypothetical protein
MHGENNKKFSHLHAHMPSKVVIKGDISKYIF